MAFGQEHRLRIGDQLRSAQSGARERGYEFLTNGCAVTGEKRTETPSGVGFLTAANVVRDE
eukprot:3137075-Pyramimonas_sp.AAC.1